ncbi:hypothetical protein DFH27DRAFT_612596 [Peziza echinospora]|nr:hypothetical protein DFH27DRAFT_612596 [Peziza echinospora]
MEEADKDWISERTVVSTCSADTCSLCCNEDDPDMEVAGLALGAIALAGPLASTCLSGYGLLKSIDAADGDAADFQLLVEAQRIMLEQWIAQYIVEGRLRGGGRLGERGCVVVAALLARISETLADSDLLHSGYGFDFEQAAGLVLNELGATAASGSSSASGSGTAGNGVGPSSASPADIIAPVASPSAPSSPPSPTPAPSTAPSASKKNAVQATTASRQSSTSSAHHHSRKNSAASGAAPTNQRRRNIRSWLSRAWCFKINRPRRSGQHPQSPEATNEKPSPRPRRASDIPTLLSQNTDLMRSVEHCSEAQIISILAALENKQAILNANISRIKGLKWVLVDKGKSELLVNDLRKWNKQLFKLLPISHVEPKIGIIEPGKPLQFRIIPHTASPIFTGRLPALAKLANILVDGKPNIQRRAVLYGIGGSGKTQIALKFIEEYREKFDSIFWIDASSSNAIEKSFSDIAAAIPLGTGDPRKTFLHWLSHHAEKNWLLVYDNADDITELHNYFPATYHGNIIITSRNPGTQDYVRDLEEEAYHVGGMDPDDAVALLLNACRLTKQEKADDENTRHAADVVKAVGYLALAIDQAGAYIFRRKCGIERYLNLYKSDRSTLLELRGYEGSGYTKAVYQTWKLSFDAIFEKSPAAAELLQVFAYFHWNGIPIEIFETICPRLVAPYAGKGKAHASQIDESSKAPVTLPLPALNALLQQCAVQAPSKSSGLSDSEEAGWEATPFEMAIYEIESYSLVEIQMSQDHKARYSIHPLVHSWIRDRSTANVNIHKAAEILLGQTVGNATGPLAYAVRSSLVPHLDSWVYPHIEDNIVGLKAPAVIGNGQIVEDTSNEAATISPDEQKQMTDLMETISTAYHETGRLAQAEKLRFEVAEWRKTHLGPENEATIRAKQDLAMTYRRRAKYDLAEEIDSQILQSTVTSSGEDSPQTFQAKLALAWTYAEQGNFARAEELERQVVAGQTRALGKDHIMVANARANLGMTLWRMDRFKEAEVEFRFSLEKRIEAYGSTHQGVLLSKGNLASAIRGQGRFEEALKLNREVVDTRIRVLGKNHQDVGRALSHLGYTLMEAGKYNEALEVEKEALDILTDAVGEYHLFTMDVRSNIGMAHIGLKQWSKAEETFQQVWETRKAVLGVDHFATKDAVRWLAKVFEGQERVSEAKELLGMIGEIEKDTAKV